MSDEKVFVHISHSEKRKEIPEYQQGMKCATCNVEAKDGFGLAGGGMGVYNYCEKCGIIVSKSIFED